MDIQPISNNKFIVGLTCDEMKDLDITYDDMDYSNIETRRVIWTILVIRGVMLTPRAT